MLSRSPFCRCMNICTGYLGELGVPATDTPMDFSAWFEAYLGGEWHTFDARNNLRSECARTLHRIYGRKLLLTAVSV